MLMFQAVNLKRAEAAGSDHTLDLFVGILRNEWHLPAFPKERYSAFIRSLRQGALSYVDAPVWQGFLGDENVPEDETHGTVYVRMPASLKRQIEAAAESDGLSANFWAMRCFEKCLAEWSARTIHV
jgi:hypothetical protein